MSARRLKRPLIGALSLLALAIPASASAHPAVYETTGLKMPAGTCTYQSDPTGACLAEGARLYVVVNHETPVAFTESNTLDATDGGVINFKRFPGDYRKTIPSNQDWLGFPPPATGVQAHATCESVETDKPENIVGWQGAEPFYAYVPWQSTSAGVDDDPADWIGYLKAKFGVDLTGMSAAQAEAACEGAPLGGTYYPADTPFPKSIALHLIEHEVEHAVAPLQSEIDGLLGEKASLQGQIEAWKSRGGGLESQVATLSTDVAKLSGQVKGLRKANVKKAKRVKALRAQLREARQHG